jgi:membrane protein DedA with SNARE-associated domain
MAAGLGAVLVAWAAFVPFLQNAGNEEPSTGATISRLSLPLVVAIAIFLWVVTLVWLLVERSRLNRRGPTLTDGLRTNR